MSSLPAFKGEESEERMGGSVAPLRRRHAVFISDFVHLPRAFEEVSPLLLDHNGEWRQAALRSATRHRFDIAIGEARRNAWGVILPLRWEPLALEHLLPVLDADLDLASLGPEHCRLSLNGRYHVPLAQLGVTLDRLAMHRVAESAVRRFLTEVAETLVPPETGERPPDPGKLDD